MVAVVVCVGVVGRAVAVAVAVVVVVVVLAVVLVLVVVVVAVIVVVVAQVVAGQWQYVVVVVASATVVIVSLPEFPDAINATARKMAETTIATVMRFLSTGEISMCLRMYARKCCESIRRGN